MLSRVGLLNVVTMLRTQAEKTQAMWGQSVITYACLLCWIAGHCAFQVGLFPPFHSAPDKLITQSRVLPPLLRLSDEIIDEIASELDLREDLSKLHFGFTCLCQYRLTLTYPILNSPCPQRRLPTVGAPRKKSRHRPQHL